MYKARQKQITGFTLIELIIVVAIIALLVSIALAALGEARVNSRDTTRIQQANEILKAMELYYTERGLYPDDRPGGAGPQIYTPVQLETVTGLSDYLRTFPTDPGYPPSQGYHYCASGDRQSMALLVNTENDKGGTEYCVISRGPQEYTVNVCSTTLLDPDGKNMPSLDKCTDRIR